MRKSLAFLAVLSAGIGAAGGCTPHSEIDGFSYEKIRKLVLKYCPADIEKMDYVDDISGRLYLAEHEIPDFIIINGKRYLLIYSNKINDDFRLKETDSLYADAANRNRISIDVKGWINKHDFECKSDRVNLSFDGIFFLGSFGE